MSDYSDRFILSQIKYYSSLLPVGDSKYSGIAVAWFHSFQAEARRRGIA